MLEKDKKIMKQDFEIQKSRDIVDCIVPQACEEKKSSFDRRETMALPKGVPPLDEWPQRFLVTKEEISTGEHSPVCSGSSLIDSDLFTGEVIILVRGSREQQRASSGKDEDAYFRGRKRQVGVILTGVFKKEVPMNELTIGNEFDRGIRQPKPWQTNLIMKLIHRFLPHCTLELGNHPKFFASVVLDAKNMRIRKRQERLSPLLPREGVKEDLSLLGGFFAKGKRSPAERRNYFRKKENLKKYSFSPEYEYTFEFYQHQLNFVDYKLLLGVIDVAWITKGQPFQFLIKSGSQIICKFHIWSENLMKYRSECNTSY